jgi:flagellar hook-basal body complex protein FliE
MSDRIDIQNVLSQMRTMKLQSQNAMELGRLDRADDPLRVGTSAVSNDPKSFSNLMANALDTVNELGMESGRLGDALERGEEGATLVQAMIASQKASIAFQAVTETRNKLVTAYEKIMNMPI